MSVLDRTALSESPLADLHAIASALSIDGYRRLRRPELIDAILAKQGSDDADGANGADRETTATAEEPSGRRRRGRRGGRARDGRDEPAAEEATEQAPPEPAAPEEAKDKPKRRRGAKAAAEPERDAAVTEPGSAESVDVDAVEGVVELLPNGSGFVRVHGSETSDDDV